MKKNKKKILVVDDSSILCDFLVEYLSPNYILITAKNGLEALKLIKKKKYDLLITDYNMGGINGAELSRRAKNLYPELPIIAMSSDCIQEVFYDAGVKVFIEKPLNLKELKKQIEKHLE